jgi:hypothetical protein
LLTTLGSFVLKLAAAARPSASAAAAAECTDSRCPGAASPLAITPTFVAQEAVTHHSHPNVILLRGFAALLLLLLSLQLLLLLLLTLLMMKMIPLKGVVCLLPCLPLLDLHQLCPLLLLLPLLLQDMLMTQLLLHWTLVPHLLSPFRIDSQPQLLPLILRLGCPLL